MGSLSKSIFYRIGYNFGWIFGLLTRNHPYIVSLRNSTSGEHLCGATLLSSALAMTAAHCVSFPASSYTLQLNNLCGESAKATVKEIIVHEQFDELIITHDIALIRINLTTDDKTLISYGALPTATMGLSGLCTTFGYGHKKPYVKEISETLLSGQMWVVSLDKCTEALGPYMAPQANEGMLCAMGDEVDSCEGDSGGPLICQGKIEGISSYGVSCAIRGQPGVFTSVAAHLDWIKKNMASVPG